MVTSGEAENFDKVIEALTRTIPEPTKRVIMTIADTLIEKGKGIGIQIGLEKGEALGEKKGKQQIARNLLRAGFDEDFIVKITGLDPQEIRGLTH